MTAHGHEALRIVIRALAEANLSMPRPVATNVTGHALNVIAGRATREDSIDKLVAVQRIDRQPAAKAIDVAVEALTATQE